MGNSREDLGIQAKEEFKNLDVTIERVLQELVRCAFADPENMFDEYGELKEIKDIDEDTRRAIAGFDIIESIDRKTGEIRTTKKYKFVCKKSTIELLGRYLAMFTDKKEILEKIKVIKDDI